VDDILPKITGDLIFKLVSIFAYSPATPIPMRPFEKISDEDLLSVEANTLTPPQKIRKLHKTFRNNFILTFCFLMLIENRDRLRSM
jgi:hypothetical protein